MHATKVWISPDLAASLFTDTNQDEPSQYLNNDASFLLNDSDGFEHFKRKFSSL